MPAILGTSKAYSAFSPQSIPGLALWLDAAELTSLTFSSAYNVSAWKDKSDNGFNGTSIGNAGSTVWSSTGLNGYPTITFDGSTGSFAGTIAQNTGTTVTMFVVASMTSSSDYANTYGRLISLATPSTLDYNVATSATFLRFNFAQAVSGYRTNANLSSANITYGLPFVGTCYWDGSSNYAVVNGTSAQPVASSGNFGYTNYNIGRTAGSILQPDSVWKGNISEVLVFNTLLTTSQRQQIEGYLAQKWGLGTSFVGGVTRPTQIPGCVVWLDGADASTVTGTTTMTAWRDKSGKGYVANSFSNSVAAPSWVTNAPLVGNAVQYSTGNGSVITNFVLAQTMSIFEVCYSINQSAYGTFIEHGVNENTNPGFYFYMGGGNNFAINSGSGQVSVNFANVTVSNVWQLTTGINPDPAASSTMTYYVNGTRVASGSTQSGTTPITANLYINGRGGANSLSSNSYLGELLIYSNAMTNSQRLQVEGYLATKWGLRGSLPSTHPYYTGTVPHPFALYAPVTRPFQPIDIPGLTLWFDGADSSSITTSGGYITQWRDKSGNANNLSVSTGGQNALISDSSYTSNTVVSFPSGSVLITGSAISYSADQTTVFLVARLISMSAATVDMVFALADDTASGNTGDYSIRYYNSYLNNNGSDDVGYGRYYVNGTNSTPTTTTIYSTYHLISSAFSGTRSGSSRVSLSSAFLSRYFIGNVAEVIVFSSALTNSQRQQVEGYLFQKWNLPAILSTPPISPAPLSYFPFEGNNIDYSNAISLTTTGTITYVTGYRGRAAYFSNQANVNAGTYATNLLTSSYNLPSSAFSVSLWFKSFDVTTGRGGVLFLSSSNTSQPPSNAVGIYYEGGGLYCAFNNVANNGSGYSISTNVWYHATITYNNGNLTLYANGNQQGNTINSTASLLGFQLGCGKDGGAPFPFWGYVDDLRIYNYALSSSQALALYNYTAPSFPSSHPYYTIPPSTVRFSPTQISGCSLWLDAADTSAFSFSSGTNISTWNDKSGNGYNATGINSPTLSGSQVVFNGSSYFNLNLDFLAGVSHQAFIVCSNTNYVNIYGATTGGNGSGSLHIGFSGSGNYRMNYWGNDWYQGFVNYTAGSSNLLCYVWSYNATKTIYANAKLEGSISQAGTPTSMSGGGTIGNVVGQGIYTGVINEIIFYTSSSGSPLSDSQRQKIEGYLARKWGMSGSLPTSHPYVKIPPGMPQ